MSADQAAAPSGVVTFLFTDVEGSTRRWEADAEGMRAALAAHDEVLRRAIGAHGGLLFKHTGDGVCAAFSSPRAAVDAAVAAQRALELPVRMGLATGEAELREGDYFGTALNRAARVMAAGHGGQILLIESTVSLLSGVELVDLGPRRLRDLPTPVGVFQVRAPGLRIEFPPLKALDVTPGNLRPATTSLIGRESEVDAVTWALREHRLVTLTGVGGVGKTRLALEVASRLGDEFPDGVWFFELAAVADPASAPEAVAAVLGITQQPGKSVADSIAAAQEGRIRLLVIDNCEHLRDAVADLIDAILAQSTTVVILATSREGLGVVDEQLWAVPPLDVDAGADSAGVRLFVERARTVSQGFSLARAEDAAAVGEICQGLDGIPLAIELAASRMASMTPIEVRDRLDKRFRLLVGSGRGQTRHQTLRHAVAWSYDHLGDAEKSLLERCSVFAGGFDLQSACMVVGFGDLDEYVVLDLLDALVRKSLLVADRSTGHTRFSMLETIRQFAAEQLAERGAAADTSDAHARYFAGREDDVYALWDSPRQREAYDWFTVELPNLRTAFRWAADHGDLDTAIAIAVYATFFGFVIENYEPVTWAEELVEPARAVNHPRLAALFVMASQCWLSGRVEESRRLAEDAPRIVGHGAGRVPFGVYGWMCSVYLGIGQPERWAEWCATQLGGGRDTLTMTWSSLVFALAYAGSVDEAMAAADGLVEAAEATRNPFALSYALAADGFAFRNTDPVRALDVTRRALAIARDSGKNFLETITAQNLAQVEAQHGDPLVAFDLLALAIRRFHDSGSAGLITQPLAILAAFLDRLGRYEPAATIAGFAVSPIAASFSPDIDIAITHLREVLSADGYELLARAGENMTTAAMATYAYDQIDQARAELGAVSP